MNFQLTSSFKPTGDQPEAIDKLTQGILKGDKNQVLLGVTGSGKTFTIANVIQNIQRPALVISHNKTLAAQLYQEFRDFFPKNAVSYFVSYYDYYQPEAYIPQTDTYIEKETEINEEIDKLRLSATTNLLTRKDTIVVASVSCIYNIGSPREYGHFVLDLTVGAEIAREVIFKRLVDLQYSRSDYGFHRSTFRVRGDTLDLFPAYEDTAIRITHDEEVITSMEKLDPLTGKRIDNIKETLIYPAKHYMTNPQNQQKVFDQIRNDLEKRVKWLTTQGKIIEAHRLSQKVNYDLEMIQETGFVNGIENYSRYFDGRNPGDPPYSLLDYFQEAAADKWLTIIDESHMTVPQIRGMYHGDKARKQTLIDFGFRMPAALDNRPLTFVEFMQRVHQTIYVSATPNDWEMSLSAGKIAEQLIRPTGLTDPVISILPTSGQIDDLMKRIQEKVLQKERVLVTTLTKKMAEALATYLDEHDIKVHYLHSDVETLVRSDILDDLRLGKYDVIVGINLLREGLDLPEVSLVAILDADKEGFLRSDTSLIQTMGRAARHIHGQVVMYADTKTRSMERAIKEIDRRRSFQLNYNNTHHITPVTIHKPVRTKLIEEQIGGDKPMSYLDTGKLHSYARLLKIDPSQLVPEDKTKLIKKLTVEMKRSAEDLNFELAATIRDKIKLLKADQR